MRDSASSITSNEQPHSNRVCCFQTLDAVFLKAQNISFWQPYKVSPYTDIVLLPLYFLACGTAELHTYFWEQSFAQPWAGIFEGCRICHYLSWADSIKPNLLFSIFGCYISKGSLFRLLKRIIYYVSHDMTKPAKWVCAQRRLRSAWASAQADQSLRWALIG